MENPTIYVTPMVNIVIHIYRLAIGRRFPSLTFRPVVRRIAFPQPVRATQWWSWLLPKLAVGTSLYLVR